MKKEALRSVLIAAVVVIGWTAITNAGPTYTSPGEPTVISASTEQILGIEGSGLSYWRIWRFWSDGTIQTTKIKFEGGGIGGCDIEYTCTRTVDVCVADLDGNGAVDFEDFTRVLAEWGPCE